MVGRAGQNWALGDLHSLAPEKPPQGTRSKLLTSDAAEVIEHLRTPSWYPNVFVCRTASLLVLDGYDKARAISIG
jgi:hypothetical protein